jgi:glycosyltransferase involved in cell wall biosynthesis
VEDGADGLLVKPGDADGMARAVLRILGEEELSARLSAMGRRKAEGHNWAAVLGEWVRVLREAAGAGGGERHAEVG